MKLSMIQVWYLLGVVSVISATNYEFSTTDDPDTINPGGGGALTSNPANGIVFMPPQDPAWWNGVRAKLEEKGYTLGYGYESCGRYLVRGCGLNLVKMKATPRHFLIKYEGVSTADGKHHYKLYLPITIGHYIALVYT